jgi:GTP-binding protein LepA
MTATTSQKNIRNFSIISHIDHGKSTLADRMLELTERVVKREMKEQFLDQLDLERERGITIKMQPVQLRYRSKGNSYQLNLIDTPGHIDFEYEVSRSLKAVEGVILLVDSSQGIQAQTIDVLRKAQAEKLAIIPVVNKIDLPQAQPEKTARQVRRLLGCSREDIIFISAKTGEGVDSILTAIVDNFPAPVGERGKPLKALIFDSFYDNHLGIVAYIRVFQGEILPVDNLYYWATKIQAKSKGVGIFTPSLVAKPFLSAGQIGYLATGLKDVDQVLIGDTITRYRSHLPTGWQPLPGFKRVQPRLFSSFYPESGDQFSLLQQATAKIALQDSSLVWQNESSPAFGRGLRGGFLGLLHAEIIQERLEREFDLSLVVTSPSVEYQFKDNSNQLIKTTDPAKVPDRSKIDWIKEPYIKLEILSPKDYFSKIMDLMKGEGAEYIKTENNRIFYRLPLRQIIIDFADKLKSLSQGYASFSYKIIGYRKSDLVRLDIFLAGERVEPFSQIVPSQKADQTGRRLAKKLKELLPRQNFQVAIQAVVGGKVVGREDLSAHRKDVTGHLYGGDRTRKDKLLQKQKKGKKKLRKVGRINLPSDIFRKVLAR